VAYI
jgi:hypothetical protein